VNCDEVDRWLDEGGAEIGRAAVLLHARSCRRCARSLAAADALESTLSTAPPAAPPGFADRVMARIAASPRVRARVPVMDLLPFLQPFPWWVRLALEPATLLAALLACVLAVRGDALLALARGGAVQLAVWLAQSAPPTLLPPGPAGPANSLVAMLLQPTVLTCLVLAAAPLIFMGSRALFGWSAALAGPRHPRVLIH
jgi:hypothetical protein